VSRADRLAFVAHFSGFFRVFGGRLTVPGAADKKKVMDCADPPPLALLAWLARRRRAGFAAEPLLAELGLGAEVLADPRLAALEAGLARGASEPEEGSAGLLAAAADQLLAQGRVGEAARLRPARRAGPSRGGEAAADESLEAMLADPEARAEWEAMDYANWVVPPGSDRRPLASLTAEWVTPAERWRVLEELRRLDDPAEHARVLDHFRRAGLDPGADHPAWARPATAAEPAPGQAGEREGDPPAGTPPGEPGPTRAPEPPPAGAGRGEPGRAAPAETVGTVAGACAGGSNARDDAGAPVRPAEEATEIDPEVAARRAFLVRLGQEAEAYLAAGRARREAEAWQRYARELGVPVPPHARLVPPDEPPPRSAEPEPPVRLPEAEPWLLCPDWHGRPRDPRTGAPLAEPAAAPAPPAWPPGLGPRPPEPVPDWPWPAGDGIPPEERARAEARTPRPAPSGKTTRPKAPAAEPPSGRRGRARRAADRPAPAPRPDPPPAPPPPAAPSAPVVWAKQPLTPFRLARIRGDYPWWL